MSGIDLNSNIEYLAASMRYFAVGEHHISRICYHDVLLLVYEGVLRFIEDGIPYTLHPGQYHIQRHGSIQSGPTASDTPKYLYVHFLGHWTSGNAVLPRDGVFSYSQLKNLMEYLDLLAHTDAPLILQAGIFYRLLSTLYIPPATDTIAAQISHFLDQHYSEQISLEILCQTFHFSKNHIINLFRNAFSVTPIAYLNTVRLQHAAHLIEATSDSLESIAASCGYQNYSHFYKQFVRRYGAAPEHWRQQKRVGHL